MIIVNDIFDFIANKVMLEDDSPYGGKSFDDETYSDFIDEIGFSLNSSVDDFNSVLVQCGFIPLSDFLDY